MEKETQKFISCHVCGKRCRRRRFSRHLQLVHDVMRASECVQSQPSTEEKPPVHKDQSLSTPALRHAVRNAVNHCFDMVTQGVPFPALDTIMKGVSPNLATVARHATIFSMQTMNRISHQRLAALEVSWKVKPVQGEQGDIVSREHSPSASSRSDTEVSQGSSSPELGKSGEKAKSTEQSSSILVPQQHLQLTELSHSAITDDLSDTQGDQQVHLALESLECMFSQQCYESKQKPLVETRNADQVIPSTSTDERIVERRVSKGWVRKKKSLVSQTPVSDPSEGVSQETDPNNNDPETKGKADQPCSSSSVAEKNKVPPAKRKMSIGEEKCNLQHSKKVFLLPERDRRIPAASPAKPKTEQWRSLPKLRSVPATGDVGSPRHVSGKASTGRQQTSRESTDREQLRHSLHSRMGARFAPHRASHHREHQQWRTDRTSRRDRSNSRPVRGFTTSPTRSVCHCQHQTYSSFWRR